ncbi:MAG: hypothetical protein LQ341_002391 [Variospora aurantia]|nr:MAG: hypothetical protein LQ341_002391 [Variospora aurantia]
MMEVLIQEFIVSYVNPKYSPYLAIGQNFFMFGPTSSTEVMAGTLGAVIAEGLSRQAYNWIVPYAVRGQGPNSTVVTPLLELEFLESSKANVLNVSLAAFKATLEGSSTLIDYTIKQYGYGYGYQVTPTVAIGLAVPLAYTAVAIAFILCTIYDRIAGTGFTSNAWGEMGEMLALAMHSERATELQNVGGGVKAKSTWKMRVRVRERKGENLELVVGQRDLDGVQPCLDKKYH